MRIHLKRSRAVLLWLGTSVLLASCSSDAPTGATEA